MASEPGGRADKLGNQFERCWGRPAPHRVDRRGTATTFRARGPSGDDEKGTDSGWAARTAAREAHQCKRENGTAGRWSVAELEAKGIISNAKFQLDRAPSHRFVFASGDKAGSSLGLTERAERCNTPAEFVTYLTTTSSGLKNEFRSLCHCLGLDPGTPEGQAKVVDFLRRSVRWSLTRTGCATMSKSFGSLDRRRARGRGVCPEGPIGPDPLGRLG